MNFNYSIRYSLIIFPQIEKLLILRNEIKLKFLFCTELVSIVCVYPQLSNSSLELQLKTFLNNSLNS